MICGDFHTHTTFCDGKNTPREMIEEAISRGMTHIGFSGHSPAPYKADFTMTDVDGYYNEIRALQEEYRGRIRVLCGIEADLYTPLDTTRFDYRIGSVHDVKCGEEYLTVDDTEAILTEGVNRLFGGDWYAFAEAYFGEVAKLACVSPNIIGHIDLLTKYNEDGHLFDDTHPRYVAAAKAAIDALLPLGVPFEINSGAISRGYRTTPYPAPHLLSYIGERGGTVILSGDAHSADGIGLQFEENRALAEKHGCRVVELPHGIE